jgi:flagellar hook-associated protein 2
VSVADGVTLNLLSSSASPVDVTVTRSTSVLSSALSSFADAYNAVVDELGKQHGQSAGALQGQSILASISRALSSISTYNSSGGGVNVLKSLGLDLQTDGHIQYNSFGLMATDITNSVGVTAFLGSSTKSGWLKVATDALKGLEDPVSGILKTTESNLQAQITSIGKTISDKQSKVDALQLQLQNRLAAADALLASMEQQYSYMSSMFQAQDTARRMYSA